MRIGIGNDHSAVDLKNVIKNYLEQLGHEVVNYGVDTTVSMDYPDIAEKLSKEVVAGEVERGILICGTGIGMSIAANKIDGIRAAAVSEPYSAKLSVQHNNANVLCFGARVVGDELAKMIVDQWLDAKFLGERHEKRVEKIINLENRD